jgi:hypothetical protein
MSDDTTDPRTPRPEQLEPALEVTLGQVADEVSISEAETSELIRIEEALAYANEVSKQAASLRRRIGADEEAPPVS